MADKLPYKSLLNRIKELEHREFELTLELARVKIRTELFNNETNYRILARNFPAGAIGLFDQNLRYLVIEGLGLPDAGLDKENMIGKTIWEIFSEKTCKIVEPHYRKALDGKPSAIEFPSGNKVYDIRFVPVTDELSTATMGIVIARDISGKKRREKEIENKQSEIERYADRLEKMNTALNVLIDHRNQEKKKISMRFDENIKKLILPYIDKAEKSNDIKTLNTYVKILKQNITDIRKSLPADSNPIDMGLTELENHIAGLIREGKTTKEIAVMLNLGVRSVYFHRNNIRKKLRLTHKKTNLRSHFLSKANMSA